jgi:4'-phosphopantetheinyl transferase
MNNNTNTENLTSIALNTISLPLTNIKLCGIRIYFFFHKICSLVYHFFIPLEKDNSLQTSSELTVWYCSIKDIASASDLNSLMEKGEVSSEERMKIMKFHFLDDKKRALISILLQKSLVRHEFELGDEFEFELLRTKENKPFLSRLGPPASASAGSVGSVGSTWNFNVSHQGSLVCIAGHASLLVGVDIVDVHSRSPCAGTAMEMVGMFEEQLTPAEVSLVAAESDEAWRFAAFYLIWSLKEAFIKAVGLGLGYDLNSLDFTLHYDSYSITGMFPPSGFATVKIAGVQADDWRFDFLPLDYRHVLTVARGPLYAAISKVWPSSSLPGDLSCDKGYKLTLPSLLGNRGAHCLEGIFQKKEVHSLLLTPNQKDPSTSSSQDQDQDQDHVFKSIELKESDNRKNLVSKPSTDSIDSYGSCDN